MFDGHAPGPANRRGRADRTMIPGIGTAIEPILAAVLDPRVTDITEQSLNGRQFTLLSAAEDEAKRLGIILVGGSDLTVVITDPTKPIGQVRILSNGKNNVIYFDNASWEIG